MVFEGTMGTKNKEYKNSKRILKNLFVGVLRQCMNVYITRGWVSWKSGIGEQGLGNGDPYMITFFLFYKIFRTES